MNYTEILNLLRQGLDKFLIEEKPEVGVHPAIKQSLITWLGALSKSYDYAIDSDFFTKQEKEFITEVTKRLVIHAEQVNLGHITPNWAWLFFLTILLDSFLTQVMYPPEPPPEGASYDQLALYFLHPACPFKTQIDLLRSYGKAGKKGYFSTRVDHWQGWMEIQGYAAIKSRIEQKGEK